MIKLIVSDFDGTLLPYGSTSLSPDVKALLRAFTMCDKTKHVTKTNLMIAALSLIGGLAITGVVAFLGSIMAVSSVYVALYQLFWLASVYLISRFLLM